MQCEAASGKPLSLAVRARLPYKCLFLPYEVKIRVQLRQGKKMDKC